MAKEAVFGTPVLPTGAVPVSGITVETTPGLFSPDVIMQLRDKDVFVLLGERKHAGAIDANIYPTMGIPLLIGAIGADAVQTGTAAATAKNGTLAAAAIGATSLTYTVTNATPAPVANDILQVGPIVGSFGNAALSAGGTQCVKVTAVSGAGPYTLTVAPLAQAVAANAVAQAVIANFYHQINPTNSLPSFTIEKNLGGFQSLQFAGSKVDKIGLKMAAGDTPATMSVDVVARSAAVLDTPSAETYLVNDLPFALAEATVTVLGNSCPQANNIEINLTNTLKSTWTFSGSNDVSYITPTSREITGKVDVVFNSLDDVTNGFWTKAVNGTTGSMTFTLAHPTGQSLIVTLNKIALETYTDAVKTGDVIISSLAFKAFIDLTANQSISAVLINGTFSAF